MAGPGPHGPRGGHPIHIHPVRFERSLNLICADLRSRRFRGGIRGQQRLLELRCGFLYEAILANARTFTNLSPALLPGEERRPSSPRLKAPVGSLNDEKYEDYNAFVMMGNFMALEGLLYILGLVSNFVYPKRCKLYADGFSKR